MKERTWSLTRRLTLGLGLGLSGLWAAAALAAMVVVHHELEEAFDGGMREVAFHLANLAGTDPQSLPEPRIMEQRVISAEEEEEEEEVLHLSYQFRDAAGAVILRSPDAPETGYPAPLQEGFAERDGFRFFTQRLGEDGPFIQVGEPLGHRQETVFEILVWLVLPLLMIVPLAALLILRAVTRSLKPLRDLRSEIGARGGGDLSPIEAGNLPRELAPMVDDVNRLLLRLSTALESERSFAGNSAHELRSPVAAALAQLQRLSAEVSGPAQERTERIAAILQRLARLVEKLLQLARAESGIALKKESADLVPVVRMLVDEIGRAPAHRDRLRLQVEDEEGPVAETDIDALAIVLRNLIENALVHGTPDSAVHIAVAGNGTVKIVNDCDPIPPETLRTLSDRFERAGARAAGSGLGLAIATTILRQAGGDLDLASPADGSDRGFQATLRLPIKKVPV